MKCEISGLIINKIEDVPTTGRNLSEFAALLRAQGGPQVRLELINRERNETNRVAVTRGKFVTSG